MARQMDQAFDVAQASNEMDTFARIVMLNAQPKDFARIATYYESRGQLVEAAAMWASSEQYQKAVQLYLKVSFCGCPFPQLCNHLPAVGVVFMRMYSLA